MRKNLVIALVLLIHVAFVACDQEEEISVSTITLDKEESIIKVGDELFLKAIITPDNATDRKVQWYSEDEAVATVNNGLVKAVSVGHTTITSKAGEKIAICKITVVPDKVLVSYDANNENAIGEIAAECTRYICPDSFFSGLPRISIETKDNIWPTCLC